MRWSILAAGVASAALATSMAAAAPKDPAQPPAAVAQTPPAATTQDTAHTVTPAAIPTAPALLATAPPNADPARTYDKPEAALLQADLDYLVHQASAAHEDDNQPLWPVLLFSNDLAQHRFAEARTVLTNAPGGLRGGLADMLEPFLLAAEGRVDAGVERVDRGSQDLPAPLPDVQSALVFESAGRLNEAAAVYSQMMDHLDVSAPPKGEPANLEEFQRSLAAPRTAHAVYRAALVQHRLGHAAEARRLYGIVAQFAPNSADVAVNLERLAHGQPPIEPVLTPESAAGRWMLFVSEYLTQSEGLVQTLSNRDPHEGLVSTTGTLFMQLGVALAPDAQDWRLYAAQQLIAADGLDGAQRIINLMPSDSVFAPDAALVKASIELQRRNDQAAVADAQQALQLGANRWPVIASAGDVFRSTGRSAEAVAAFDRALAMVSEPKDRADILGFRAYAHRYAGEFSAATADMRAAYAIDQGADTRMLYVSILMDDPQAWRDGVQVARGLFAEDPNSVSRLNALGYALIQHPEGLEEGYRLLWRGFNFGQQDYAVIDSLGWAYYQYGSFDEARALVERANDLSSADPNPEVLDHLGDIYWRLNRHDDAKVQWRKALEHRPEMPRRRVLEAKVAHGLTTAAPAHRALPTVNLPQAPAERGNT